MGEETELCQRIKMVFPSSMIVYNEAAIVYHRVPECRLSLNYIWTRSYNEGYYKAKIKKSRSEDLNTISTESDYLSFLLLKAIPLRIKNIGSINCLRQIMIILYCIVATGSGYLIGLAHNK
jgi:hypothetical protein